MIIFIFSGCERSNQTTKIHSNKGSSLEEIIENELLSGVKNDTIFLDFTFGMTERNFAKRLRMLLNSGKIYRDKANRNILTYDLTIDQYSTFKCTFSPEYYKKKLFKLGISVQPKDQFSSVKATTLQLAIFYMAKYGPPDVEKEMQLIDDCKEYIWIDGNRKIEITCGISDSRIWYEDLGASQEKLQDEKTKIDQKRKESRSDI